MGRFWVGLAVVSLVGCGSESPADQPMPDGPLGGITTATTGVNTTAVEPRLDLGAGPASGTGNASDTNASDDCGNVLTARVRDFSQDHPDFQHVIADDRGLVEEDLGDDGKPVYAGGAGTVTTNGQEPFDQWYRDVDGINMPFEIELVLADNGDGTSTYDNSDFFPVDGQGFGNEGNAHNYHFTLELLSEFTYEGGEVFSFTGDDDLFVFMNGKLVMDLGGVHTPQNAEVVLDDVADQIGLSVGESYPIAFFFAERHTSLSNFRIDTSIGCFVPSDPPPG